MNRRVITRQRAHRGITWWAQKTRTPYAGNRYSIFMSPDHHHQNPEELLAQESGLNEERQLDPLLRSLPKAMRNALADALKEGAKLPERMVSTFRREFRRR